MARSGWERGPTSALWGPPVRSPVPAPLPGAQHVHGAADHPGRKEAHTLTLQSSSGKRGRGSLTVSRMSARWLQDRQAGALSSGAPTLAAVCFRAGMPCPQHGWVCRRVGCREGQDRVRSLLSALLLVVWAVPVENS